MKRPTKAQQDNVLRFCFVALTAFSENALTPTQKTWARERAENCLWALGIPEFKTDRSTYRARQLDEALNTIDLNATRMFGRGHS
jgi:hypothetical protein